MTESLMIFHIFLSMSLSSESIPSMTESLPGSELAIHESPRAKEHQARGLVLKSGLAIRPEWLEIIA